MNAAERAARQSANLSARCGTDALQVAKLTRLGIQEALDYAEGRLRRNLRQKLRRWQRVEELLESA